MKKSMVLGILVAGVATSAIANGHVFNEKIIQKAEQSLVKGHFRVLVTKFEVGPGGSLTSVVVEDYITTECLDFLEADNLRITKQNSYLPQRVSVSVTKVSNC